METRADLAIRVRGLRRTYGRGPTAFEAVRGVDLEVSAGTVTALLGTNGAGKTSALEVIEGLAPATAGEVQVLGLDPVRDRPAVRRRTGVLLQDSGFPIDLTAVETLRMWRTTLTWGRTAEEMLGLLDLEDRADTRVRSLSGGERRRLDLACTLMGRPELVLLDEPTTGLDPESRRRVWQLLTDLRAEGTTVLLTTHYLEEAEALADRLAIMHGGRIVREGSPGELAEGQPSEVAFVSPPVALPALSGRTVVSDGLVRIETGDLQATLGELLGWAAGAGVRLERLSASTAGLESVFLAIAAGRHVAPRRPEVEGSRR